MTDYQPIDYRLRCHTKRTDLPADVLRDIGEAYAEIQQLRFQLDEEKLSSFAASNMVDELTKERDEARRRTNSILTEIDCRIEHGADSNGHLEAILSLFKENTID